MLIDVVVVNYRTPEYLDTFISSFFRNPDPDLLATQRLIVVNVEPTKEDQDVVDMLDHWPFWVIEHPTNVGYARACNSAVVGSEADVFAFFNADAWTVPEDIYTCANALMSHDDWGVLGPKQVDSAGRITHAGIFGTLDKPKHRGWKDNHGALKYVDIRDDCVSVSGSAYFVKRSVWELLHECPLFRNFPEVAKRHPEGAFLPTQHYYEETYLSYHAITHGFKVVYFGPVTMHHDWHKASPIGFVEKEYLPASRELFRAACDYHGIPHD